MPGWWALSKTICKEKHLNYNLSNLTIYVNQSFEVKNLGIFSCLYDLNTLPEQPESKNAHEESLQLAWGKFDYSYIIFLCNKCEYVG